MIDEEVETVLREIRERVISQPLAEPRSSGSAPVDANGNLNSQLVAAGETGGRSSEALARLNAHLTTTARAWDRLPPVFSNRSGTAARIEVWLKARLKAFSRWFTWEQVNFNAAVHHALSETLKVLTGLEAQNEVRRVEIQTQRDEIDTLRKNQQREASVLRAEIRGELEGARIQYEDQRAELLAKIETQLAELSEQVDRIENEQRVCFKQFSLETDEMVVANDRAQQRIRALLEEINQRIKRLEDSGKRKPGS